MVKKMAQTETFTITCYRRTKRYPESKRKEMADFFLEAMLSCDGSESERYQRIYGDLISGVKKCTDVSMY